jgi:methionyl-tRNA formyltransferase
MTAVSRPVKDVTVLGKGTLAIRVAEHFHTSAEYELTHVVPSMPEPTWTDSLTSWAQANGVAVIESGDFRDHPAMAEGAAPIGLAFSVFYSRIVTAAFIDRCERILNLHNGPLPRYRGVSPINWALKNEEDHHGVTIHEITPGIDDGPIVAQTTYSIFPEFDEVQDVYARSLRFGWTLFEQTVALLDRIVARPQDESQALYYALTDNDRLDERRGFTRARSQVA